MFQFTTTNVINSDKDLSTGKDLYSVKDDTLMIKRVANFKKDNISAIYKAGAVDPVLEEATVKLSALTDLTKGTSLRLVMYIGLTQASQDSRYSNDMIYKGKPFSVEFAWKGTAADTATALKQLVEKYQVLVYGDKQLTISGDADIVIGATTEYQRFKAISLEKYVPSGVNAAYPFYPGTWEVIADLGDNADTKKLEITKAGKEGFGTYSFLLHNLRLPTSMRTRAFGINQDETPIVGAKYNQYTIHYCVDRGPLGLNAVGDTVKSTTTHVFYVLSTLAEAFEAALKEVGTITPATKETQDQPLSQD